MTIIGDIVITEDSDAIIDGYWPPASGTSTTLFSPATSVELLLGNSL